VFLGYNTNGLAHHRLLDAVDLLAELGYKGVAVTIDHHALAPDAADTPEQLERLRSRLTQHGMRCVIETGARYLLDSRRKHEPTLVSPEREQRAHRVAFYRHAIDCAASLQADCVSLWSGVVHDGATPEAAMDRLTAGLRDVLQYAERREVAIAFEPEPGMLIDSMAGFQRLLDRVDHPWLGLTLDIGHLQCQGELPLRETIGRWTRREGPGRLLNVHLDDARRGTHEHLMFGQGEIDFRPVFTALARGGYTGGLYVELSRHGHVGPEAAREAIAFCTPRLTEALAKD